MQNVDFTGFKYIFSQINLSLLNNRSTCTCSECVIQEVGTGSTQAYPKNSTTAYVFRLFDADILKKQNT